MLNFNIICWYLDRTDMSILPVFKIQDLQRTNGTNKVQKAIWVLDNEILWASGAMTTQEKTQLKITLGFSAFLFDTEDEAMASRDALLDVIEIKTETKAEIKTEEPDGQ